MKRVLLSLLVFITAGIFFASLLSVAAMQHGGNMPMTDCPFSRFAGNQECFFNTDTAILAALEHIASISSMMMATLTIGELTLIFILAFFLSAPLKLIIIKISSLIFQRNHYRQLHYHQDNSKFSYSVKYILDWLCQKNKAQLPNGAYLGFLAS